MTWMAASDTGAGRLPDEAALDLAQSRCARGLAQSDVKQPRAPLPKVKKQVGKVNTRLTVGVEAAGTLERQFLGWESGEVSWLSPRSGRVVSTECLLLRPALTYLRSAWFQTR